LTLLELMLSMALTAVILVAIGMAIDLHLRMLDSRRGSVEKAQVARAILNQIAEETERSRSFHVQKALENYIEDFADVQIAIDRLRDPRDSVVSSRDLRKSLGL